MEYELQAETDVEQGASLSAQVRELARLLRELDARPGLDRDQRQYRDMLARRMALKSARLTELNRVRPG